MLQSKAQLNDQDHVVIYNCSHPSVLSFDLFDLVLLSVRRTLGGVSTCLRVLHREEEDPGCRNNFLAILCAAGVK